MADDEDLDVRGTEPPSFPEDAPDSANLERLGEYYPLWEFWIVPRAVPHGRTWCARMKAEHSITVHADSPARLGQHIQERLENLDDDGVVFVPFGPSDVPALRKDGRYRRDP